MKLMKVLMMLALVVMFAGCDKSDTKAGAVANAASAVASAVLPDQEPYPDKDVAYFKAHPEAIDVEGNWCEKKFETEGAERIAYLLSCGTSAVARCQLQNPNIPARCLH